MSRASFGPINAEEVTFSYPGSERVALRGVSLQISPGEVVTLARTFFLDAPLVILDEPTAALDAKAEHELFARIGEAWALLLIHNITATTSARAAGSAGIDPGLIPFTAVLGLIRSHVAAETLCRTAGTARQPAGQPEHRDPRPAPPPSGPPANIRENRSRTTNQAHRRSHLHHRHHKVESPEMGQHTTLET